MKLAHFGSFSENFLTNMDQKGNPIRRVYAIGSNQSFLGNFLFGDRDYVTVELHVSPIGE